MFQEISFVNADAAFRNLYEHIQKNGTHKDNTVRVRNIGFYIENPADNSILTPWRNWNQKYADREWAWYESRNTSVAELKKFAPIWDKMHGGDNIVNSNYGHAWHRNDQLEKTVKQLIENGNTRQAYVSIFDGKEKDNYQFDTPCTMYIGFEINGDKLDMNVSMRSNDLWYGFCNDQYCFSLLMCDVLYGLKAAGLDHLRIGRYFHFVNDLHLYKEFLYKNNGAR